MLEADIMKHCMETIRRFPAVKRVREKKEGIHRGLYGADAFLEITTDWGPVQAAVKVIRIPKAPILQHLIMTEKKREVPRILLAEYVQANVAEDLKNHRIHFVDCQGNAFLYFPGKIFVDIQGRRPKKESAKNQTALFQPKGMQLLFVLLTQEKAINEPIRVMMKKAGIAFERTATSIKELKDKGFVYQDKDRRLRFIHKKDLMERWLANYCDRLRPKLVIGTYRIRPSLQAHVEDTLKTALADAPKAYALGGGVGADLLTGYYRGPAIDIFIDPAYAGRIKEALNLIPAKDTNVTLLNLFTPDILFEGRNGHPVANPLLVYAELLCHGGDRERDTAAMVYNRYLKTVFHED